MAATPHLIILTRRKPGRPESGTPRRFRVALLSRRKSSWARTTRRPGHGHRTSSGRFPHANHRGSVRTGAGKSDLPKVNVFLTQMTNVDRCPRTGRHRLQDLVLLGPDIVGRASPANTNHSGTRLKFSGVRRARRIGGLKNREFIRSYRLDKQNLAWISV